MASGEREAFRLVLERHEAQVQQQVVTLRFQQELALEDIAKTMLLPLNTVKSHLRRAVTNLRRRMRGEGGDHGL